MTSFHILDPLLPSLSKFEKMDLFRSAEAKVNTIRPSSSDRHRVSPWDSRKCISLSYYMTVCVSMCSPRVHTVLVLVLVKFIIYKWSFTLLCIVNYWPASISRRAANGRREEWEEKESQNRIFPFCPFFCIMIYFVIRIILPLFLWLEPCLSDSTSWMSSFILFKPSLCMPLWTQTSALLPKRQTAWNEMENNSQNQAIFSHRNH